jgi:hypothetical protein
VGIENDYGKVELISPIPSPEYVKGKTLVHPDGRIESGVPGILEGRSFYDWGDGTYVERPPDGQTGVLVIELERKFDPDKSEMIKTQVIFYSSPTAHVTLSRTVLP